MKQDPFSYIATKIGIWTADDAEILDPVPCLIVMVVHALCFFENYPPFRRIVGLQKNHRITKKLNYPLPFTGFRPKLGDWPCDPELHCPQLVSSLRPLAYLVE
jgi:hypothetical protein